MLTNSATCAFRLIIATLTGDVERAARAYVRRAPSCYLSCVRLCALFAVPQRG